MRKLDKQKVRQISGLLRQGDLSLVRLLSSNAIEGFKKFYNQNRINKIEALLKNIDYHETVKSSKIDVIHTSLFENDNLNVDDKWLFESLGALHTLVFYIQNISVIPNEALGFLRLQLSRLSHATKTKIESSDIVYFNRHDLDPEQYDDSSSLWTKELEK